MPSSNNYRRGWRTVLLSVTDWPGVLVPTALSQLAVSATTRKDAPLVWLSASPVLFGV